MIQSGFNYSSIDKEIQNFKEYTKKPISAQLHKWTRSPATLEVPGYTKSTYTQGSSRGRPILNFEILENFSILEPEK